MKKLTLMSVMAVLCLQCLVAKAQYAEIVPFQMGERVPDLPLKSIINFRDSTATLSTFGDKLVILDFWDTHCGTCIKMFPLEDSLQAVFGKQVQFILVTKDSREKVSAFVKKYNAAHAQPLSLPIVVEDVLLHRLFRFTYIPHYVWIMANGQILAESSHALLSAPVVSSVVDWSDATMQRKRLNNQPESQFTYLPLTREFRQVIQNINN